MKKLDSDDEPKSVPFLVYLKAFFLIGAIIFGMFFLRRAAEKNRVLKQKKEGVFIPSSLNLSTAKNVIQEKVDHEIRTNETYKTAVEVIENERDKVLGEATKAADALVEKSKQTFFDYVYEHTVGVMIQKMVEQMPDEQKEKLIEKVKE